MLRLTCAQEYIRLVLQHLGPDQQCTIVLPLVLSRGVLGCPSDMMLLLSKARCWITEYQVCMRCLLRCSRLEEAPSASVRSWPRHRRLT